MSMTQLALSPPPADTLFVPLLFAAACLGHFALVVAGHNFWYGSGLGRRAIDLLQFAHGLLFLAGPPVFWLAFGFDLRGATARGHVVLGAYVYVCWLVGFVVFPALTLWRRFRPRPAALESNHTHTVDVAKALGYRPFGRGSWRPLALLPWNEVFTVDFTEKTLRLPRLAPEWEGLSVLHLTDFHFCGTPDKAFYRDVLDRCAAWEPDVVAFTGDLVDTDGHYRWIVPLLGRLRWREQAFAILGNHDFYFEPARVRRRLGKIGMQVLGNSWKRVELRGRPLVVIGHEGPWFGPPPDLSACPSGVFKLCLSHTPDHVGWGRRHGVDLMLSGHVHGGQVCLPLVGPILLPSRYGRRYAGGTFQEGPTVLHVSRGLGGEQPLRYNCRPEVTKLILRRASGSSEIDGGAEGGE